jgi:phosphoglycolate phosphatase
MTAAVVFDLDGTLIHSAPDIHLAAAKALEDFKLEPLDLKTITSFIGNGLPVLSDRVMKARGIGEGQRAEFHACIAGHYDAVNGQMTRLYPGVADALKTLAGRGHPLGLCTNKPEGPTRDILKAVGLGETFASLICGDSLSVKKPDPDPLVACFAELGGEGVYVGDSEIDAETAVRAGVPFALFTEGYRKSPAASLPHAVAFSDFSRLPGIVAEMGSIG